MENILQIHDLVKYYGENNILSHKKKLILNNVNIEIPTGQCVSIVGESGSGKTTLGKCILGLTDVQSGEILFNGTNVLKYNRNEMKEYRNKVQMIFQNPKGALNPNKNLGWILEEGMKVRNIPKNKREEKIIEMLPLVGLDESYLNKFAKNLSGGQAQRILILASLLIEPKFLVCDEVVSALDMTIQSKILNLLKEIQSKLNLSILFITHDLTVAKYISDKIYVINNGNIVESGNVDEVLENPTNDYTKQLLKSSNFYKY